MSNVATPCPADILRCPVTHGPGRWISGEELDDFNQQIGQGELRHADGSPVQQPIQGGWISHRGPYLYAVRDEITIMIPELAIITDPRQVEATALRQEKQVVQDFYDEIGWEQNEDGTFVDAERFEDLRPVAADYLSACHRRVSRHISAAGHYLLDVASGPVQYDDYLQYSATFSARICMDLSFSALKAAKRRLGEKGICILGDITNMPLQSDSMDAAVSLHTIYHVPANEQASAFRELHRVIQPGKSAAVVYAWKTAWMRAAHMPARLFQAPFRLLSKLRGRSRRKVSEATARSHDKPLYFHAHPFHWFQDQNWPFEYDVRCWRSASVYVLQSYFHRYLFGGLALQWLFSLEERYPEAMGRRGAYPLIIIHKEQTSSAGKPAAQAA